MSNKRDTDFNPEKILRACKYPYTYSSKCDIRSNGKVRCECEVRSETQTECEVQPPQIECEVQPPHLSVRCNLLQSPGRRLEARLEAVRHVGEARGASATD